MQKQLNELWDVLGFDRMVLVAFIVFLFTGVVELSCFITSNHDKLPPGWSIVTDGNGYYAPRSDRDGIIHYSRASKDIDNVVGEIKLMDEYYYAPSQQFEPSNVWHVVGGTNK